MKYEQIAKLWHESINIDMTNLAEEAIKVPNLHAKFYDILCEENLKLKKYELEYEKLYRLLYEYYTCRLSDDILKEKKLEPFQLRLGKDELKIYLNSDDNIIESLMKISIQKEKVDFLKSIIEQINKRSYLIRSAIDFLKWSSGG